MSHFSFSDSYDERQLDQLKSLNNSPVPTAARILLITTLLATIATMLFMVFVPWVQNVTGSGRIVALDPSDREQAISALVPGRIAEWYVREGSRVAAGDPIARIVDNDPRLLDRLNEQLSLAEDRLANAVRAYETARLDTARKAELLAEGLVSRFEYEQAQIKEADFDARRQSAADEVNRARVALSREGSQEVTAPRGGIITSVVAGGTATFVSAGDPLALFVPTDVTRAVELYVDGRDISLIEPGRLVRLQFEGWPVVQFSGWPSIAVGTFAGRVTFVDPLAGTGGAFRIVVAPDPDHPDWPPATMLRLGTQVRGWALLDSVPVGYELWRQLNNFPPEFPDGSQGAQGATP